MLDASIKEKFTVTNLCAKVAEVFWRFYSFAVTFLIRNCTNFIRFSYRFLPTVHSEKRWLNDEIFHKKFERKLVQRLVKQNGHETTRFSWFISLVFTIHRQQCWVIAGGKVWISWVRNFRGKISIHSIFHLKLLTELDFFYKTQGKSCATLIRTICIDDWRSFSRFYHLTNLLQNLKVSSSRFDRLFVRRCMLLLLLVLDGVWKALGRGRKLK